MFTAPKWESNVTGDKTCKELFQNKFSMSKTKLKNRRKTNEKVKKKSGCADINVKNKITKPVGANERKNKKVTRKVSRKIKNAVNKNSPSTDIDEFGRKNNQTLNKINTKFKLIKNLQKSHKTDLTKKNSNKNVSTSISKTNSVKPKKVNKKKQNQTKDLASRKRTLEDDSEKQPQKKKLKLATNSTNINLNQEQREVSKKCMKNKSNLSLRERMIDRLKAARFRYINEQIYTNSGQEIMKYFENDVDAFKAYHTGYRQQVQRWNINPLDIIIKNIKNMPKEFEIADFGCGDAQLSKSVEQKVHSFDVVAVDESVTVCDMAHVPLTNNSVNVVVFCLSLMGTNLQDYLLEANRVLKVGGLLKIAEVESRFDTVDTFIAGVEHYGFVKVWKDLSHKLFYFIDFKKEKDVKNKKKLPTISLNPCLYKKR